MADLNTHFFGICLLAIFTLTGFAIRAKVRFIQNIFLPAAIIGGFLGLLFGPYALGVIPVSITSGWQQLPGILINIIFATLFLGVKIPPVKMLWSKGGSQLCFGVLISSGQYLFALLATGLILIPVFNVHPAFGTILEIGFAGGHGTAAGMAGVFEKVGFTDGAALGYMSATVGIITAIVGGIFFVNRAIRKGYCKTYSKTDSLPEYKRTGLISLQSDREAISTSTVASESIEPLAFHFAITGIAILLGWGMLFFIKKISPSLDGFPLFPLAMTGGLIVQIVAGKIGVARYFDKKTFDRILGVALELLVVSAIASLRLDLFLKNIIPFTIIMIIGISWVFFCLLFLAPRMLPGYWFEQGIAEYGMQTGVTAIGLLLLRLVDPGYKTDAAQAFGFKQMVYEPFLGGGFITATVPLLIFGVGIWWTIGMALLLMIVALTTSVLNGWFSLTRYE